jgi:hypothetical protein
MAVLKPDITQTVLTNNQMTVTQSQSTRKEVLVRSWVFPFSPTVQKTPVPIAIPTTTSSNNVPVANAIIVKRMRSIK